MPSLWLVQESRLSRSAGSVIQSRYWTRWSPLRTKRTGPRAILPIREGGAGGRFFSVRRRGVAGGGGGGVGAGGGGGGGGGVRGGDPTRRGRGAWPFPPPLPAVAALLSTI